MISHYYIINLRSLILCLLFFWKYIYLSLFIIPNAFCFISNCILTIMWWRSWDFCNFISHFIANQVTSCFCCFLNYFFWGILSVSVADCLAWSSLWRELTHLECIYHLPFLPFVFTVFTYIFNIFLPIFFAKDKNP